MSERVEFMIKDPYEVLGIDRTATQDEIKSAYRKAAKKYHPDLHPDDPSAAEKMNEVNQAYDMLMNPERYTTQNSSQEPSPGSYGQAQYSYYDSYMNMDDLFRMFGFDFGSQNVYGNSAFAMAEEYISRKDYASALRDLESVQANLRSPRWYYLYALANEGNGNHQEAVRSAQAAAQLDPDNLTYVQLLQQLSGQRTYSYRRTSYSLGQTVMRFIGGLFFIQILFWIIQFLFMGLAW